MLILKNNTKSVQIIDGVVIAPKDKKELIHIDSESELVKKYGKSITKKFSICSDADVESEKETKKKNGK